LIAWQNQPPLCRLHLPFGRRTLGKEKGADQASSGAMRTALGELEAAF
jgi:hypothetical protein